MLITIVICNYAGIITEDGEVFQIKKSPQSKKLVRLLDKERKKKKDVQNKDGEETQQKKVEVSNDDIVVGSASKSLQYLYHY